MTLFKWFLGPLPSCSVIPSIYRYHSQTDMSKSWPTLNTGADMYSIKPSWSCTLCLYLFLFFWIRFHKWDVYHIFIVKRQRKCIIRLWYHESRRGSLQRWNDSSTDEPSTPAGTKGLTSIQNLFLCSVASCGITWRTSLQSHRWLSGEHATFVELITTPSCLLHTWEYSHFDKRHNNLAANYRKFSHRFPAIKST